MYTTRRTRSSSSRDLVVLLVGALVAAIWTATAVAEEFVGPFPSWANAKTDYGAAGDGKADDTAAIQKALDELRMAQPQNKRTVLYLPAGTYRITDTLNLIRQTHNESMGVSILGEHPDRTTILWDGPDGGVMFYYGAWFSRIGRLTFDGRGRAATAIRHGPNFVTSNEFADVVIKNVGFGIEAGEKAGIAETAVLRCRFYRCSKAAISIQNWNSLDWWIWHSLFEDCKVGLTNRYGAGHFHVYQSLFRNSTEADMTIGNTQYFSIRNNTSVGSKAFFVAGPQGAGAQLTFQGNVILDCQDAAAIVIGNRGPVLLLDNVIRNRPGVEAGPQVSLAAHTEAVSVGNTFTLTEPIKGGNRLMRIGDRVVKRDHMQAAVPELPGPPPQVERPVIEVASGADGEAIQKAIDQAAALKGQRPIVHLPPGHYAVKRTLVVPANCDVQIVGDSLIYATSLNWAGKGEGPLLRLEGPSRATLRELMVNAREGADGIVLTDCDQRGGCVFAEQLNVVGAPKEVGLLVDGLAHTNVLLHDFGHSGAKVGVKVIGPGQNSGPGGRVYIFSGASSNNKLSYDVSGGGWLLVRDMWYETGQEPAFMHLTDSGTFTLHNAIIAHPRKKDVPGILIDDFRGKASFLGVCFASVGGREDVPALVVSGQGAQTKLLALGVHGNGEYFANQSPRAKAARLLSVQYIPGGGAKPIEDVGQWDEGFILEMLEQTRGARPQPLGPVPPGATDVRIYRVMVSGGRHAVAIKAAQ